MAGLFPEEAKKERTRPVSEELTEIRFTVDREELELLQKLLDRKAHSNFQRSYKELFLALAKKELQKLEGKQPQDALLQCRNWRKEKIGYPVNPANLGPRAPLMTPAPRATSLHRREGTSGEETKPAASMKTRKQNTGAKKPTASKLITNNLMQPAARTTQRT